MVRSVRVQERPVRVAHVIDATHGGSFSYARDTVAELKQWGYEAVLVHPQNAAVDLHGSRRHPARMGADLLAGLLAEPHIDIVHSHGTVSSAPALLYAIARRSILFTTYHVNARRGSSPVGRLIQAICSTRVHTALSVSHYSQRRLRAHVETEVLPLGVPLRANVYQPSSNRLLVLQRLEPDKRTDVAIEAFHSSGLAHHGWTLDIAGEGSQLSNLQSLVADRRLSHAVKFLGWVDDPIREIARASLLIAPCPTETFGLSVVDAMSLGVPVMAAGAGGHLEVLGPLASECAFAPDEADTLCELLTYAANQEAWRVRLGESLRMRQRKLYSRDEHIAKLAAFYEAAMAER